MPARRDAVAIFEGVTLGYGREPALSGIDGEVGRGEMLAVIGPNGAGKSTLLKSLVGEAELLGGRLVGPPVRTVAYLPQRSDVDRGFPIAVADFAALGLWARRGPFRAMRGQDRDRVAAALDRVGLGGAEGRLIGALSGGQMQRLLFARTLLQDAPVILLDEPFASVDADTTEALLAILSGWHREGRTVLAALHDLRQVAALFPTTLLLAGSPVAWGATADVLTSESLDAARRFDRWGLDGGVAPPGPRPPAQLRRVS